MAEDSYPLTMVCTACLWTGTARECGSPLTASQRATPTGLVPGTFRRIPSLTHPRSAVGNREFHFD